jgi:hypothetical protein
MSLSANSTAAVDTRSCNHQGHTEPKKSYKKTTYMRKTSSDMKLNQMGRFKDSNDLKTIYMKWNTVFDGFCKKKLNELKAYASKLVEDNAKLNYDFEKLNETFLSLNTSYKLLRIDLEEAQNLNSKLEAMRQVETPGSQFDYRHDYFIEDDECGDEIHNLEFLKMEELKKSAETQYDCHDTLLVTNQSSKPDTHLSSYKEIFRKIYDVLDARKAI